MSEKVSERILLSQSYLQDSGYTECFNFYIEGVGFGDVKSIHGPDDPTAHVETQVRFTDWDHGFVLTSDQQFSDSEEACGVIESAKQSMSIDHHLGKNAVAHCE